MEILKAIKTEKHYHVALSRLENIFDAKPGTAQGDEAELLMILIQDYENRNYFIDAPSLVEAIKFRMEQMNLIQKDLVKYVGSASRVSEILNGKRTLTMDMVIALHHGLCIPLESLITSGKTPVERTRYIAKSASVRISVAREKKAVYYKKKKE